MRLALSPGKLVGPAVEQGQFKEENSRTLPEYEIPDLCHGNPDDGSLHPASPVLAERRRDGAGLCGDADHYHNGRSHSWNPDSPPELVHLLPCGDPGELVGKRKGSIDDQLKM